ncbi:tetratricopeptide repeat protein [Labrys wisconsinensis]|uniref:Tetratricopeptide (TPR) repeat protein n=1 Tax=Labrys wisconsinensis TaxID=425677 RepID=A0ABU0JE33_9HYPH|nr:tetratricopeptide repeat protein [Labrys wisconsinensis]MDQ0472539.1 tetratricopeptide (TPR) repeat protein [Labrys wisconsinensis]
MPAKLVAILLSVVPVVIGVPAPANAADGAGTLVRVAQAAPAAEDIFWQTIQNSTDPAMFEAYLDQVQKGTFPGTYKALAEIKIKSLRAAAPPPPAPETAAPQSPPVEPAGPQPVQQPSRDVPVQPKAASSADLEACDRAAADPRDKQKPDNLPGVEYNSINTFAAIAACRKVAETSDAPARVFHQLARSYDKAGNVKDAVTAYGEAVKRGHSKAAYNLATIFVTGPGGMKKDYGMAFTLYEQSKAEVPNSLTGLGLLYQFGRGIRRDLKTAMDYYQQAIDAGDPNGYAKLGNMTYDGIGMRRNRDKACSLWQEGATRGDPDSGGQLKRFCKVR